MSVETRLAELNIVLPPAPPKGGVYRPCVVVGELAYLSGHGPYQTDGSYITGRLGEDLSTEQGQAAARQVGLALLATLKDELGSLDRIQRVIKSLAFVNSTSDFAEQPQVINGYSELFAEVFGDAGIGARSAIGTNALPGNIAVEIEVIVEVE
ncbi:MAG: RidA family protein [Verrucomicrobiota bacterium]